MVGGPLFRSRVRSLAGRAGVVWAGAVWAGAVWAEAPPARSRTAETAGASAFMVATFAPQPENGKALSA